MKIVFFGTPDFAEYTLKTMIEAGFDVVAVVTTRDQMGGRGGKQLLESPVKKYAVSRQIPVLQPEKLKDPAFIEQLKAYDADVFIVVAFRMLPEVVWNMPPMGSYNLHGSLLPKYRGAAPIHWAVINGETETGVTIFKLKHEIDTGDIILRAKMAVSQSDTTGDVHDRMKVLGAETMLKALALIEKGPVFIKQDDAEASPAPKIFHEDCQIDFNQPGQKVYNFIRGMIPHPAPWTILDGHECKILEAELVDAESKDSPGTITTDQKKYMYINTADNCISVKKLKIAGKKEMTIQEYLSGHKIQTLSVGDQIVKM